MTYIFTTEKWNEDEKWRIQSENTLNIGHIVHCQCAKPYIFSKQHTQGQLHINSPTPKMKEPLYYGFWVLYILHLVHELCTQYFCYLATNNIFRLHVIFLAYFCIHILRKFNANVKMLDEMVDSVCVNTVYLFFGVFCLVLFCFVSTNDDNYNTNNNSIASIMIPWNMSRSNQTPYVFARYFFLSYRCVYWFSYIHEYVWLMWQ